MIMGGRVVTPSFWKGSQVGFLGFAGVNDSISRASRGVKGFVLVPLDAPLWLGGKHFLLG